MFAALTLLDASWHKDRETRYAYRFVLTSIALVGYDDNVIYFILFVITSNILRIGINKKRLSVLINALLRICDTIVHNDGKSSVGVRLVYQECYQSKVRLWFTISSLLSPAVWL